MKQSKRCAVLLVTSVMVLAALLVDWTIASNMAFKGNRQIVIGINLISLPYRTEYTKARDICMIFGKTTSATAIAQFTGTSIQSYTCDQLTAGFSLLNNVGIGLRLNETAASASGIIVGSHRVHSDAGGIGILSDQSVTLPAAGPFPIGVIIYNYPWHTTRQNARDICQEGGLTTTGTQTPVLVRYGPLGTVDGTYTCSQTAIPGFGLRQVESIQISGEVNGPKTWIPQHY